jgi:purine nucleosidase
LLRPPRTAPSIHGETGLDGPVLPEPQVPLDPRPAADLIIETVLAHEPGEVALVPIGPLTNIASALRRHPALVDLVGSVVLMGGGYAKGNVTAAAEFNIYCDPEAAAIVFGAGWPVTQIGLDLTHQALAIPTVLERIAAVDTAPARFVNELLLEYGRNYRNVQGFAAPPVHDPCAVARIIDPTVVATRPAHVEIELTGTHTTGMTVTDFVGRGGRPLDTEVAVDLDHARFWDLVVDAVARLA